VHKSGFFVSLFSPFPFQLHQKDDLVLAAHFFFSVKRLLQTVFFLSSYPWGYIFIHSVVCETMFESLPMKRDTNGAMYTRRMKLYGAKLISQLVLIFLERLVPHKY